MSTNSLELNAEMAIVNVLMLDSTLAAVPPRQWNNSSEAEMPRIAVKARQGAEIAGNYGMYRMACEVIFVARILADTTDDWMRRARSYINDRAAWTQAGVPGGAETLLTTSDFFCKGVIPMPASSGNDSDKRTQTLAFEIVGYDLDRFEA